MKKIELLFSGIFLAVIAGSLVSCEMTGEGEVINRTFETEPFTGIDNEISADVHLTKAQVRHIEIFAQQNIIDIIRLEVRNGILTISFRENARHYDPVNINISMPELSSFNIYGSGDMNMTNSFDSCETVRMGIFGSGSIDAYLISNSMVYSVISGSGNIRLNGSSPSQDIRISGSGAVRGFLFNTNQSVVAISGSGYGEISVNNTLNVTISGSGNVFYKGQPVIQSTITGSGKVYNSN